MALIAGPLPVRFETFCSEETLAFPANTEFFLRLAALRGTFIDRTVLMLEVPALPARERRNIPINRGVDSAW